MKLILALALIAASAPAAANWRCPHGQLYRIHLGQCVSLSSPLAWNFGRNRVQRYVMPAPDRSWYVEITRMPPDVPVPAILVDDPEHYAAVAKLKSLLK